MTIYNVDTEQGRIDNGQFTFKPLTPSAIGLEHPELPEYDPNFFYDRVGQSAALRQLNERDLDETEQANIRIATQAVNDSWALQKGTYETGNSSQYVETTVYRDGNYLVADVQHKDQSTAPLGSLIVFDVDGKLVGSYDNEADNFGDRWTPTTGLRSQILTDLLESSADGSLGDHL